MKQYVCALARECDSHLGFRLDAGALADERLDHLKVPIVAGDMERRPSTLRRRRRDAG